jgi:Protein of unknown function (DUF3500)
MTWPAIPGLRRWRPRDGAALLLCFAVAAHGAAGESVADGGPETAETRGAEEPVEGITANGQPVFGLFPIESTGVPTEPLVAAAGAFLEALREQQRERARLPVDDPAWRRWSAHHDAPGAGVSFAEMSRAAREAALELLEASLGGRGFALTRNRMRSGEWQYRIAVMGEPSASEPWGWQLEGDHLVINYFVLGEQVVMSPVFMGAEPAASGDTAVLQDEQDQGRAMLQSLSEAQRQMAIIGAPEDGQEIVAGESSDNAILENVGIPAALMDREQRSTLLALIERYVGNLREEHAAIKMAEVEAHLDDTYFAWSDGDRDSAFYYRIFSPVVLIELDSRAARDHVHAVIRTPNGNDYGNALLRQHLAEHPHD